MNYLTVSKKGIVLTQDGKTAVTYTSVDHWIKSAPMMRDYLMSSLLDFPEDMTSNPAFIDLADLLRGNNVGGGNPEFKQLVPVNDKWVACMRGEDGAMVRPY